MRDELLLGAVGVVCITILAAVYFIVLKQNGTVLGAVCGSIGTIIGLVLGRRSVSIGGTGGT